MRRSPHTLAWHESERRAPRWETRAPDSRASGSQNTASCAGRGAFLTTTEPTPEWLRDVEAVFQAGQWDRVRDRCRDVLLRKPTTAQAWVLMAQALEEMGDRADAWASYDRGWMLDPQAPWAAAARHRFDAVIGAAPSPWLSDLLAVPRVRVIGAVLARNEAANLPRCLAALAPAVDAMIVVDSGSTDGTQDLARASGATLVETTWNRDFGSARNAALPFLGNDGWALWVDADEFLDPEDAHVPRTVAALFEGTRPPMLLRVVQVNHIGEDVSPNYDSTRMYPLGHGIHWKGRIHEQVVLDPDHAPRQRGAVRIRVHHWGYEPEVMRRKGTLSRNLALLKAWTRDEPKSTAAWGFLGRDLYVAGQLDEAIAALRRAEALARADPGYLRTAEVRSVLCEALVREGRLDEAREMAERTRREHPDFPAGHYWYAQIRVLQIYQDLQEAGEAARQAQALAATYRGAVTVPADVVRFLAPVAEADARRMLGDWTGALALYEAVLREKPGHEAVIRQVEWMEAQARAIVADRGRM